MVKKSGRGAYERVHGGCTTDLVQYKCFPGLLSPFLGFYHFQHDSIERNKQERQQPAMPVLFPFVPPFFFSMCVRVSLPATYYAICVHPPINDWAPALISLLVAV